MQKYYFGKEISQEQCPDLCSGLEKGKIEMGLSLKGGVWRI